VSVTDQLATIAAATDDSAGRMTASAASVSVAVSSIAAVSQENSAAAEEVSASTEQLSAQAEEVVASAATLAEMADALDVLFSRFTLDASDTLASKVETFKSAHLNWVDRLQAMLGGRERIRDVDVPAHTGCALGKWYYGPGKAQCGGYSSYRAVEAPHQRFHERLRAAVVQSTRGEAGAAESSARDATRLSGEVVSALDRLERECAGHAAQPASPPHRIGDVRRRAA
jgi:methyl-accepting chemotaxis protein